MKSLTHNNSMSSETFSRFRLLIYQCLTFCKEVKMAWILKAQMSFRIKTWFKISNLFKIISFKTSKVKKLNSKNKWILKRTIMIHSGLWVLSYSKKIKIWKVLKNKSILEKSKKRFKALIKLAPL